MESTSAPGSATKVRLRNERAGQEACFLDFQLFVSSARVQTHAHSPFLSLTFVADPDTFDESMSGWSIWQVKNLDTSGVVRLGDVVG